MGFGAEMEMKLYLGEDEGDSGEPDQNSPGGIVVETLVNIRTVASLTIEDRRSAEFSQALRDEDPTPIKSNFIKGSASGLGQFIQMWGMGKSCFFVFPVWSPGTFPDEVSPFFRWHLISPYVLVGSLAPSQLPRQLPIP
jgi:ATP-binding cassette subfamily B (MDR/TAP) protein 1